MDARVSRRSFLAAGGVLIVGLGLDGLDRAGAQSIPDADRFLGKSLAPDAVDSFLAVHRDGSVTIFVGRVDLAGGRIAMRQLAGEELDIPLERIAMIEGDTALTPNQGGTGGSYGIARGGSQLRRAAATARHALIGLAAQRLGRPAGDLGVADGVVRARDGGGSVTYGELIGDRALSLKVDAAAALKPHDRLRFIGQPLPRPDLPAKITGHHRYLQDLVLPGMLHARVIRPPAHGAALVSVDESSIAGIGSARTVRIQSFLAVVGEREWDAVRAARALKTQWSAGTGLPDHGKEFEAMRASRVVRDQEVARRGDLAALSAPPAGTRTLAGSYRWPMQTHGSIGPSCGVADVRADRVTVWTSSQNVHGFQGTCARVLGVERDRVRVIYITARLLRSQRPTRGRRGGSAGRRSAGTGAVEPAGGARARSQGPGQASRPAGRGGQGRRGGRVGDAGVAAHRDRQPAEHPAPGPDAAGIQQPQGCPPA
jgi:CO/xanthine dehydrogenase Mo-binding subunit